MAVDTHRSEAELPRVRAPEPGVVQQAARTKPIVLWAAVGALLLAFELFVLAKWVTGPNLVSTKPGPDKISDATKVFYVVLQVAVTAATLICLWIWVIRPWRREGRLTTDGMLAISGGMLFFWDMCMNYTSVSLLYNSHLVNLGAWANGSWPGWTSPNGNLLPEPLFVSIPGYTCLVFAQVVLILFVLRKVKARRPNMGMLGTIGVIVVGLTIIDTIIEGLILRSGVYAYPGGISAITLFAGHTYQVPMSETFLFGGLGLGALAALSYFRDDKGQTIVERGIDRLRVGPRQKQWVKFLAIFGAVHLAFVVLYMVPQQWFATHADSYPKGYKSYMINGMCEYPSSTAAVKQSRGITGVPCAGPGVPIPRPAGTL
jgi:HAMP domain-containing protein